VQPRSDPEASLDDAADEMRKVVERLRDQAWMVAPVTAPLLEQPGQMDMDLA
jgi:hypothetical protein